MDIKAIQKALKSKGFDPGKIDGVFGRQTIAAVRAFQEARGLTVDGIPGPQTVAALASDGTAIAAEAATGAAVPAAVSAPLVWFEEALRQLGTKEKPGPASNPKILQWASALGIPYKNDDIPWCGLFVAHCVGSTLTQERLPNNPLGARNWLKFGTSCKPQPGAVLVFWRVAKKGALGHVGFYKGEDADAFHVLGGNQSNKVSVARVAKDRLLGARQPATAPALTGGPVQLTKTGALSGNEA